MMIVNTLEFEVPQKSYDDFLNIMGVDLFLNEDWHINKYDFIEHEELFKTVMTNELHARIKFMCLTEQIEYIKLMRSNY